MLYGSIDSIKHNLLAVPFVSFCGNDSPNRNLLHVSTGRAYTGQCNDLVCYCQPQVDGFLVIAVHVLIDAVLLNHEHLTTHSQEFV